MATDRLGRGIIVGASIGLVMWGMVGKVAWTAYKTNRAAEGRALCIKLASYTNDELKRLNLIDGMKPDVPVRVDDYCGAQCRPGSLAWDACLDACRDYCESK